MIPNSGAPINGWLLVALVGVVLHLASNSLCQTVTPTKIRVNLLNPYFNGLTSIECDHHSMSGKCNIQLETMSSIYNVTNMSLGKSIDDSYIERVADWTQYKVTRSNPKNSEIAQRSMDSFDEIKRSNISEAAQYEFTACDFKIFLIKKADPKLSKSNLSYLCIHESEIIRYQFDDDGITKRISHIPKTNMLQSQAMGDKVYIAPFITGNYFNKSSADAQNDYLIMLLDVTGRLFSSVVKSTDEFKKGDAKWTVHNFNAISLANEAQTKYNDLVRANKRISELHNKFKDVILPLAHLRTISGIHIHPSNGTTEVKQWCYSSAMFPLDTPIKCLNDGNHVENRLNHYNGKNILYASHLAELDGFQIEHYAMRDTNNRKNLYVFCRTKIGSSNIKDGITPCETNTISNIPADIIGYSKDGCNFTVAIFRYYYQVFTGHSPITKVKQTQPKFGLIDGDVRNSLVGFKDGIYWKTAAVTVVGDNAYFFTYLATLMKVPIWIEKDPNKAGCETIKMFHFNIDQATEANSLTAFLLPDVIRMSNTTITEMHFDQELAENSNETQPATIDYKFPVISGKPNFDDKYNDSWRNNQTNTTSGSSGTMIIIIAVGLILGGLLLVAIIYLFCLRTDAELEPGVHRDSKHQPAAGLENHGSKLHTIETVRSHLNGSKAGSKITSPGSKAKQASQTDIAKQPEAPSLARKTSGSRRSRSPGARPLRSSPGHQKSKIHSKSKKLKSHASGTGPKSGSDSSKNSSVQSKGSQMSASKGLPPTKGLTKTPRSPVSSPSKSPSSPTKQEIPPSKQPQSRVISLKTAPSVKVPPNATLKK